MNIYTDINALPLFKNAVVTIGTFDGVHTGHQHVLSQLKKEARAIDGETVIITFHPHPRMILKKPGQQPLHLLNTLQEKTDLLYSRGIDHVVVVPFDESFAHQEAKDYIHQFLFEKFRPHTVIIGYDHRFGRNRAGDYHLLEDEGKKLGIAIKEIPEHILNEITISSTRIRSALTEHSIDMANEYLGYHYSFEGKVVEGDKRGRTIGYPTANLVINDPDKLIPANGVYAVNVQISDNTISILQEGSGIKQGMMNIGIRPTVDGSKRSVEVNIFDFDQDIYGKTVRVYVKKFLREEQKFNGLDELKTQLAKDKEAAKGRN